MTSIVADVNVASIIDESYSEKPVLDVEEGISNDSNLSTFSLENLYCVTCSTDFNEKGEFYQHLLKHVQLPSLILQRVDQLPASKPAVLKNSPLKLLFKTTNSITVVKQVRNTDRDNKEVNGVPRVPKLRILLPEQVTKHALENPQQTDATLDEVSNDNPDKNVTESESTTACNGNKSPTKDMVELQTLPSESQSPSFPGQSPAQPEVNEPTTDDGPFWPEQPTDDPLQLTQSGEKEAETHNNLLQNFLNDTTETTSKDSILASNETEYISLDRLAGPQCSMCGERCLDQSSLEVHQKAMGHYPNNSLVPYNANQVPLTPSPLESLANLPMQQLAQQVNRLQQGSVHQQNVLINIQQFGQPMGHPQYRPPDMPHYSQQQHYPPQPPPPPQQQPQPPPHMYGMPPGAPYHQPGPPHPMYYPPNSMYPPAQHHQYPPPPPPHPSMMRPRGPPPPSAQRMPPPPPPPPPQPLQQNQSPQQPLPVRSRMRPPMQQPPRPNPGARMQPPRPPPPRMPMSQPPSRPLRRIAPMPNEPQSKRKRMDVLIPDTNDNDDCHVISMQKCNDGLPIIKNVQGAASAPGDADPVVHLTDSITLSVRNPSKDAPVVQKKNDAKAVANILATRGITVTPAAKTQKESSELKKQPTASKSPPVAISLNSAVSIIPTARSGQQSRSAGPGERSPRPPTVDLTDDEPPNSAPAPAAQQKQPVGAGANKRGLPHHCDLCPAQYPTLQALMNHRRTYHKAGSHELGVPVIDLKQPAVLAKLVNLGIQSYIPLPQLSSPASTFALPVVSINSARNPNICNLAALGSGALLPLGPLRHISNLPNTKQN